MPSFVYNLTSPLTPPLRSALFSFPPLIPIPPHPQVKACAGASFAAVAIEAMAAGRRSLATQLLEHETDPARQASHAQASLAPSHPPAAPTPP